MDSSYSMNEGGSMRKADFISIYEDEKRIRVKHLLLLLSMTE